VQPDDTSSYMVNCAILTVVNHGTAVIGLEKEVIKTD
jgi:hypothetical protein